MQNFDISKLLFQCTAIGTLLLAAFGFGIYSGAYQTRVFGVIKSIYNDVELVAGELFTFLEIEPEHFLQSARHDGSGIVRNELTTPRVNELVLLSGFFDGNNEIRLIRRDGEIVARWVVRYSEIFPKPSHNPRPPATDWNIDLHGVVALPDGAIVFNFERGGLVKLDKCGNVLWVLSRVTHHSVTRAEGGGFWVPGRRFIGQDEESPYPPLSTPLEVDTLLRVSDEGSIMYEISVPQLFYDNDLEALLTATGHASPVRSGKIVHLNKVEELTTSMAADFPAFMAGDLAVSLRMYNLVFVVSPTTRKIKWWKIGPWIRQHDPDFNVGGMITVFNNNTDETPDGQILGGSNIMEIDPATNEVRILYGSKNEEFMFTNIRGMHQMRPDGGIVITEFEAGRVFETDANGTVIWEYINRYDASRVAEITGALVYPALYFDVANWSCEQQQ